MEAGRPTNGDRAASLVEFALIAPLLFSLLLGTVTGGLALATKNSMTNAVREGARLGATAPEGSSWDDWAAGVKDRVVDVSGGDVSAAEVCVALVSVSSSGASVVGEYPASGCSLSMAVPATPAGVPVGSCVVKVWAETSATLSAVFFSRSLDLQGKAVGRYERDGCP